MLFCIRMKQHWNTTFTSAIKLTLSLLVFQHLSQRYHFSLPSAFKHNLPWSYQILHTLCLALKDLFPLETLHIMKGQICSGFHIASRSSLESASAVANKTSKSAPCCMCHHAKNTLTQNSVVQCCPVWTSVNRCPSAEVLISHEHSYSVLAGSRSATDGLTH